MKISQNFKKETNSVIIIASIALIVVCLSLTYFADSRLIVTLAALVSTLIAMLLGLFISSPMSKEVRRDSVREREEHKEQPRKR